MGDLDAHQQAAARALLKAVLSPKGYEKTMQIVEADEMLKSTDRGGPGGPGGAVVRRADQMIVLDLIVEIRPRAGRASWTRRAGRRSRFRARQLLYLFPW